MVLLLRWGWATQAKRHNPDLKPMFCHLLLLSSAVSVLYGLNPDWDVMTQCSYVGIRIWRFSIYRECLISCFIFYNSIHSSCTLVVCLDEPAFKGVPGLRWAIGGGALPAWPWSSTLPPWTSLWGTHTCQTECYESEILLIKFCCYKFEIKSYF